MRTGSDNSRCRRNSEASVETGRRGKSNEEPCQPEDRQAAQGRPRGVLIDISEGFASQPRGAREMDVPR